ncbi:UNVERIFIED_CONTAM: Retrovirus-related Pol polyprotein from transposon TNT 1-94 [Sesamum calycinum]|uniref:Retrovirus-related Pol polyprotein from transposon TNT 1-94 n=1 Tax=Sesamum calycinum TaxID=2727403 RepID=A0AAW2QKH4_9LAMI
MDLLEMGCLNNPVFVGSAMATQVIEGSVARQAPLVQHGSEVLQLLSSDHPGMVLVSLPLDRAYSTILRVKRQRQVHLDVTVRHDGAVMHAGNFEKRKEEQKEVTKDNTISISDMVMELVRVLKQIPHDPIQVNHTGEYAGSDLSLWHQKLGHPSHKELKSYTQAQGHFEWERAMAEEVKALEANNTWEVTSLPAGKKAIARDSIICLYVDDILVMGPLECLIMEVKSYLDAFFTIKDLGYVKYILSLEVARSPDDMSIAQHKYVVDIISGTGMTTASSVLTPLPPGIKLTSKSSAMFRQYLQRPTEQHWHAALHVVRYLKGTPTTGLCFPSLNTFQFTTYVDADWGACVDSRCSMTSYCVFLGSSLISWKTKKQNIAALHITANSVFHERSKHLDIDCHVVRDKYKDGFISPSYISTKLQLADIFTKLLFGPSFHSVLSKLGLISISPVPA